MKMKRWGLMAAVAAVAAGVLCGCSAPRVTETGRTAVEQFLISTVVDQAIKHADFSPFFGKKIFIEYDYLAPQVDKPYVQGVFEMHLAAHGLIVTRDIKEADLTVQIICGVLATDLNKFMIGTPTFPVPVPDTTLSIAIPEIPLFQKLTRTGFGRFSFNILEAATRKPVKIIPGIEASTYFTNWTILLIPFKSHNMPLKIRQSAESSFDLDWE